MFCTSLRRRPSAAQVIPKLIGPENLGLRESRLDTHDLALSIATNVDSRTGSTTSTRQLRVLLFSPADTAEDKLPETLERIRRFAALTGGQDLAIIFILNTNDNSATQPSGEESMIGYSKLQATMLDNTDIPRIPILPLANLDGLAELLKKHVAHLSRPKQQAKPTTTPFALLQLCSANPPMSQQTAYILSDLFSNLCDLATACTRVSSAPNSSSPSARATGISSQVTGTQASGLDMSTQHPDHRAVGKLRRLRDLVGEQECANVFDFWKDEWVIE